MQTGYGTKMQANIKIINPTSPLLKIYGPNLKAKNNIDVLQ